MKKLLLFALIPLVGIKRTQASENGFKNLYDQIASYYFTFTPEQQAAITAGFVFAHGLGYVLGKKIRSYCDIHNRRVITVEDTDTQIGAGINKKELRDILLDLEVATSQATEQDLIDHLESNGWSCHFDKDLERYVASENGTAGKIYYCHIKDNKMGWVLRSYKNEAQLEEAKRSKIKSAPPIKFKKPIFDISNYYRTHSKKSSIHYLKYRLVMN